MATGLSSPLGVAAIILIIIGIIMAIIGVILNLILPFEEEENEKG